MRNPPPFSLLVVVALACAAAGYYGYRQLERPAAVPRAVAPPLQPAADAPATEPAAAIPAEVPDLVLPDLAGKRHALRAADGHPRLFNFWATWCEPCRREIPLLNTLQGAYEGDGLQVVGIAVDFRDAVQKYLKTTKVRYALLVGEEDGYEAAQKFGMDLLLPFSVFADERNRIVAVKIGELHRDEADAILGEMRLLKAGKISLPEAQAAIAATMKALSVERAKQSTPK